MKRIISLLIIPVLFLGLMFSCDEKSIDTKDEPVNEEQDSILTYDKQKEIEATQISKWISDYNITVTGPASLLQDSTSNVDNNEYVLFEDTGVLMQIVRRGDGKAIEKEESRYFSARFVEVYIGTGDTISMNIYQQDPDNFYVRRNGDAYTASFTSGILANTYGMSVPNAWLMVMPYIKPGTLNSNSAKVRLIVPHNQGTQKAAAEVYPTFYEITIASQRW